MKNERCAVSLSPEPVHLPRGLLGVLIHKCAHGFSSFVQDGGKHRHVRHPLGVDDIQTDAEMRGDISRRCEFAPERLKHRPVAGTLHQKRNPTKHPANHGAVETALVRLTDWCRQCTEEMPRSLAGTPFLKQQEVLDAKASGDIR